MTFPKFAEWWREFCAGTPCTIRGHDDWFLVAIHDDGRDLVHEINAELIRTELDTASNLECSFKMLPADALRKGTMLQCMLAHPDCDLDALVDLWDRTEQEGTPDREGFHDAMVAHLEQVWAKASLSDRIEWTEIGGDAPDAALECEIPEGAFEVLYQGINEYF